VQKESQGLLVQATERTAQLLQETVDEMSMRQRMEQEAIQNRNERMRLKHELTTARALVAVPVAVSERLPDTPGVELRALEVTFHEERTQGQIQRDVHREVQ
jgi:hypothetical protein